MAGPDTTDRAGEFLEHFGVKGMRWGVRKPGTGTPSKRKRSADFDEVKALRKKHPSELSNAELKKLTERMNLEQNYARLVLNNPSKIRQGSKVAKQLIDTANTAYATYNSPAVKAVRKTLGY